MTGPSGVSMTARSPAASAVGEPISTARRPWTSAIRAVSSASSSGAAKSVASITRCTNVPTSTPGGMSASSEAVWPAAAWSAAATLGAPVGPGGSSASSGCSGSLVTQSSWLAAVMSL